MKATYFAPGAVPKAYDYQLGSPGTINLLNASGRVIVSDLPYVTEGEVPRVKCYAVIPALETKEKVKSPSKPKAPKPEPEILMPSEVEATPLAEDPAE
jgi:hypothetical protein